MFLQVCVCPQGGGCYPSMHCRWYPSMPCSRSRGGGGIPAYLAGFQAHTQGEVEGDLARGVSRLTPKGKLREIWQGCLQAHTQGGSPGPHSRGKLGRIWTGGVSRPTPGGSPGPHTGDLQAHTQGGVSRPTPGGSPGPHPGGSSGSHWGGGCLS